MHVSVHQKSTPRTPLIGTTILSGIESALAAIAMFEFSGRSSK